MTIKIIKHLIVFTIMTFLFFAGCVSQEEPLDSSEPLTSGIDFIPIDQPLTDFTAWDLEGNEVQLADYKGDVIFLYFWATWCGPCRASIPTIQEFYEEHKDSGVVVLAVSSTQVELRGGTDPEQAEQQVEAFAEEKGITFPILLDRYSEGWQIYQQRGIPANYVIDEDGIVRFFRPGPYESKQQMIDFLTLARN